MKPRILAAAALGGLALLVVTTLLVFQFGRENPSPPWLIEHPNPAIPGEVIYRGDNNCIVRATASGESREDIYCGNPASIVDTQEITWVDATTIGFVGYSPTSTGSTRRIVKVDIATGQVIGEQTISNTKEIYGPSVTSPAGDTATMNEDGRLYISKDGKQAEIADFDVDGYRIRPVLWSPDSEWLVLFYTPPRDYDENEFWIIKRDGSFKGTLATGIQYQTISWRIDGVGITPGYE